MNKILTKNRILIINYIKGTIINILALFGMSIVALILNLSFYHHQSLIKFVVDAVGFPLYMSSAFQVVGTLVVVGLILFGEDNIFDSLFKEENN